VRRRGVALGGCDGLGSLGPLCPLGPLGLGAWFAQRRGGRRAARGSSEVHSEAWRFSAPLRASFGGSRRGAEVAGTQEGQARFTQRLGVSRRLCVRPSAVRAETRRSQGRKRVERGSLRGLAFFGASACVLRRFARRRGGRRAARGSSEVHSEAWRFSAPLRASFGGSRGDAEVAGTQEGRARFTQRLGVSRRLCVRPSAVRAEARRSQGRKRVKRGSLGGSAFLGASACVLRRFAHSRPNHAKDTEAGRRARKQRERRDHPLRLTRPLRLPWRLTRPLRLSWRLAWRSPGLGVARPRSAP
jgi:hypothetical protein